MLFLNPLVHWIRREDDNPGLTPEKLTEGFRQLTISGNNRFQFYGL